MINRKYVKRIELGDYVKKDIYKKDQFLKIPPAF